ncbi:hypothetical protein CEE80_11440, partial [Lactobacillus crispatus]
MDASLCGVLRALFGDFLSLLSGMKLSVPLAVAISTFLADMIDLLLGLGCRAHLAPAPLPVGETGVARARAAGAEGAPPAGTSGFRWGKLPGLDVRAEGRGDRPGRSRIFRDFTLARARAEPLAPKQKKGVCAVAKRRPVGSRET